MSAQTLAWICFGLFVITMLVLDLGVFHRKSHVIRMKEALCWSAFWVSLALIFNLLIWQVPHWFGIAPENGGQKALEFLTGYVVEQSLSIDNMFVFLMVFAYFRVPKLLQHKALFWGILGALIFRAIFIFAGIELIQKFHWMIYVFGLFLVITGIKMLVAHGKEIHPESNPVLKLFRRMMPVTPDYVDGHFFVKRKESGKMRWWATPLFVTLLFIETTDIIFAVDSIPAILAISHDPFIVYTSNVFAILGLRSLFFALAGLMNMFRFLGYGLAVILMFVGGKMLLMDWVGKMPTALSLGVIAGVLLIAIVVSALCPRAEEPGLKTETPEQA
jgi:tellurite resistance protein TerC